MLIYIWREGFDNGGKIPSHPLCPFHPPVTSLSSNGSKGLIETPSDIHWNSIYRKIYCCQWTFSYVVHRQNQLEAILSNLQTLRVRPQHVLFPSIPNVWSHSRRERRSIYSVVRVESLSLSGSTADRGVSLKPFLRVTRCTASELGNERALVRAWSYLESFRLRAIYVSSLFKSPLPFHKPYSWYFASALRITQYVRQSSAMFWRLL